MRTLPMIALAGVGLLAACGYNEPERAQGGAAAGAATGAAWRRRWSGRRRRGRPDRRAAGATTGAVTSPHDVNLGPPPWSPGRSGAAVGRQPVPAT